jgi:hypothetical protein
MEINRALRGTRGLDESRRSQNTKNSMTVRFRHVIHPLVLVTFGFP